MGFIYHGRKLCCDFCGDAGARKMHCPHEWCQDLATCPACRKLGKHKSAHNFHENCRDQVKRKQREIDTLKAGGLTLVVKTYAERDGEKFYRFDEFEHSSAAADIFHKTWMNEPELVYFRALGHTLVIHPLEQTQD